MLTCLYDVVGYALLGSMRFMFVKVIFFLHLTLFKYHLFIPL